MTYRNIEIGNPTLEQVEKCVARLNLACKAIDVYNHYYPKHFLTLKGNPIKSLEAMCTSFNGKYIERERKKCMEKVEEKNKKSLAEYGQFSDYVPYMEQLKNNNWRAFRQFVLTVRGAKCESCGAKKNLNIHHLKYISGCRAWEYSIKDVMVLCRQCHLKIHGRKE